MTTRQEKDHPCLFYSFRYTMLVFVFVIVACQNVFAKTYFVDPAAVGSSDGSTEENAWNTLQQVNVAMGGFAAGDHIQFKRGSIFSAVNPDNKMLTITASGTEVSPIVFETYDIGDPPIIDGSQVLAGPWTETSAGSGIWSHAYPLLDPDNHRPNVLHYDGVPKPPITTLQFDSVPDTLLANAILLQFSGRYTSFWATSVDSAAKTVSGITFYDISETAAVVARQLDASERMRDIPESPLSTPTIITSLAGLTEPGHWYWYDADGPDDGRIYLKSEGPPDAKVRIGFVGDYTGELNQAEIKYPAVQITSQAHDVIVRDLKIQKCNESAIVISNGSTNITVERMDISDCGLDGIKLRDSSNNVVRDNVIDNVGTALSIWAFPGFADSIGNEVLNNTVSNCRTKCISISFEKDVGGDPSEVSGNRIAFNTVTNANTMEYESAGIYTFYAGSNIIESNTVKDGGSKYIVSAGIMVDVSGGPMTIRKNTLENNSNTGISVSGAGHQITDNILRNNGLPSWKMAQMLLFTADSPAENCRITGNTMEADQDHHFIYADPGSQIGHFIDNNVYISPSKQLFSWSSSWDEVWVDFPTWRRNTGHDLCSTLNSVASSDNSCSRFPFLFMPAIISGSGSEK